LVAPEHLCGGEFEVGFAFLPGKGLMVVSLESLSGNPNGTIGECVLSQLTKQFGRPKSTKLAPRLGGGEYYQFYRLFSRRFTAVWTQPERVVIHYTWGRSDSTPLLF